MSQGHNDGTDDGTDRPAGIAPPLDRRDLLKLAGGAMLLSALAGCGSGSGTQPFSQGGGGVQPTPTPTPGSTGTVATAPVTGTVNTREVGGSGLRVSSAYQQNAPVSGASGAFAGTVSQSGVQLLTVTDGAGALRALGLSVPDPAASKAAAHASRGRQQNVAVPSPTLDGASTALTAVFMTPGILTIDPTEATQRINDLKAQPSFVAFSQFVAKSLPTTTLTALKTSTPFQTLKRAAINDFLQSHTHRSRDEADDPASQVTATLNKKDSNGKTPIDLNNTGFRFVSVLREDLDAQGNVLKTFEKPLLIHAQNPTTEQNLISGANAVSWGSILTGQVNGSGSGTEARDLSQTPGLAKVRYRVAGFGFAPINNPLPASIPESAFGTAMYGTTLLFYTFLPLVDLTLGTLTAFKKGYEVAGVLWAQVGTGVPIVNVATAVQSNSIGNVEVAVVDTLAAFATAGVTILTALEVGGPLAVAAAAVLTIAVAAMDGANLAGALQDWATLPRIASVTVPVVAGKYKVTEVGGGGGAASISAHAINDAGQIIGTQASGSVLWDNGTITGIGGPADGSTFVFDINSHTQVIGQSGASSHIFLWQPGTAERDLGSGVARAINDSGQIVGSLGPSGFLYDTVANKRTDITHGSFTQPLDINNAGVVLLLGSSSTSSVAALYDSVKGTFTELPLLPNGNQFTPNALNNNGDVVGMDTSGGSSGAIYVYSGGQYHPIKSSGHPEGDGSYNDLSINDAGQVLSTLAVSVGGEMTRLDTLVDDPAYTSIRVLSSNSLNNKGQIVAAAVKDGTVPLSVLLTPEA